MKTLLIAEDNASNFDLLVASGGRNYKKVLCAHNGIEAVGFCNSEEDIGLVLMDISMPEMTGYEATRIIRTLRPELPVIALTAYINDQTEDLIKESGFDDFLLKPYQLRELVALIKKHLGE
jgi:CheY-like chemotaxis protein